MKSHSVFGCGALIAVVLLTGGEAAADPFELIATQYGVNTGVLLVVGSSTTFTDGLPLTRPIDDYLANKTYSAQIVQPGSGEQSEAYAQVSPTNKAIGFGSALADGRNLEVGTDMRTGVFYAGFAVSRMSLTIKNNHDDRSLTALEFAFELPAGHVEVTDFARQFLGTHARVQATIDYRLLSPEPPFGGTFEETTGQLFNYWVDLGPRAELTHTSTASVQGFTNSGGALIYYAIDPYADTLHLPIIPPRGELTLFYDMYAVASGGGETLAAAFLGDPSDLIANGGFSLRLLEDPGDPGTPGTVPAPEPASLMLLGAGLVATAAKLRTKR